ncbi:MAG: hypothetical protein HYW90_01395 [Candidatus Sungbacteria bacterium]|nr:hypothetical protein [Candidatus Sungbacteria bacterium]
MLIEPPSSYGQTGTKEELEVCRMTLNSAVHKFVRREIGRNNLKPHGKYEVRIPAFNDLQYSAHKEGDAKHCMSNAVIVVESDKKLKYTIVHIHFSRDGTFKSAASMFPEWWIEISAFRGWHKGWCTFLIWQPEEYELAGCKN